MHQTNIDVHPPRMQAMGRHAASPRSLFQIPREHVQLGIWTLPGIYQRCFGWICFDHVQHWNWPGM